MQLDLRISPPSKSGLSVGWCDLVVTRRGGVDDDDDDDDEVLSVVMIV